MDYQIRAHDRVPYTNDLHGELILKMIQLKERVEALQGLKQQRMQELNDSEARVGRLKRKVQELELYNDEVARENCYTLEQRKLAAEQQIAAYIQKQSELHVQKKRLLEYEQSANQKHYQAAQSAKYEIYRLEDKTQGEIYYKMGFLQYQASLKEQIVKAQYERDEYREILAKSVRKEAELRGKNAQIVLADMAQLGSISIYPALQAIVYQKAGCESLLTYFESLDQQFMKQIASCQHSGTQVDYFSVSNHYNVSCTYVSCTGQQIGVHYKLANQVQRQEAPAAAKALNVACEIKYCDTRGSTVAQFRQVVQNNSCVQVQEQPRITVRYLSEEEKKTGKWAAEVAKQAENAENEQNFSEFERQKRAEDAARQLLADRQKRALQTPNSQPYKTPENLTTLGYSQLVPDVFSPQQQRKLEESIRQELARAQNADRAKRERPKPQKAGLAKMQLEKRQIEETLAALRNERNGLRKRLDSLQFDKGGDAQLRRAEIAQIKQLLAVGAAEMKSAKERLARVLILLQVSK